VTAVVALTTPLLLASAAAFVGLWSRLDFVWSISIWLPITWLLIAIWAAMMVRTNLLGRLVRWVQQRDTFVSE